MTNQPRLTPVAAAVKRAIHDMQQQAYWKKLNEEAQDEQEKDRSE